MEKFLDDFRLIDISEYLFFMGVINKSEKEAADEIRKVRNKFIHRKKGSKYLIGSKANAEYEPLVKEVIQILENKLNAVRISVFH